MHIRCNQWPGVTVSHRHETAAMDALPGALSNALQNGATSGLDRRAIADRDMIESGWHRS